jgi:hypothetical protein
MTGAIMAEKTKPVSIRLGPAEIEQLQARAYTLSQAARDLLAMFDALLKALTVESTGRVRGGARLKSGRTNAIYRSSWAWSPAWRSNAR